MDHRRDAADSRRRVHFGLVTFIMFEAAYFCEIMRAGIQTIPRGSRRRQTRSA